MDVSAVGAHLALRHVSAELLAACLHIFDFRAVVARTVERSFVQFVVGNRNSEARAEHLQFFFVQLLLLVRDVLAFAGFAKSIALNGLRQNNRWANQCARRPRERQHGL